MASLHISLPYTPKFHQNVKLSKVPKTTIFNPHKTTFKLRARSSFEPVKESNNQFHLNTATGLLRSLTSSLSLPISEISNLVFSTCSTYIAEKIINPPLHPSVDPEYVLTGNFAPVDETSPTECFVMEGELPASLNGAYIRNGPNPQHEPRGPHHMFSGDGMLHSIKISNGRAIFSSRYVQTLKYKLERDEGREVIPNAFSGFYGINDLYNFFVSLVGVVAKRINLVEAFGLANTSLAIFHGNIFALMDGDLPYKVRLTKEGDIETLERYDFNGKAPLNMNAHPKFDPDTNELFGLQLHAIYPHLTLFRFNGSNREDVPISSVKGFSYVHDMALTKRYMIVLDIQLQISLNNIVLCKGIPVSYHPNKVSRIGILPRDATSDSDLRWFDVQKFNAFHILNAWEENKDQVVLIMPTIMSPHDFMYNADDYHMYLEKITIDMKRGAVSRTVLSKQVVEMGTINPKYYGKKNRYAYMAMNRSTIKMCGVVKMDLELECEVAVKFYGPGCYGGEAYFVPSSDSDDSDLDEDDGFVVSFVHNEKINESYFVVLDAKTLEFVSKVKLPSRVPYGLHGLFVTEKQLENLHGL